MAPLTPADVKRWDADAIHGVFQTATDRAATLQTLGDNLQQVHSQLSDWQGEAGDAFRADLNKTRRYIEADGHESKQVAAAVASAEADVRAVKAELGGIEQAAEGCGFTITPDWRIDSGGMKLDGAKSASKQQLQGLARRLQIACSQRRPGTGLRRAQRRWRHSFSDRGAGGRSGAGQPSPCRTIFYRSAPARATRRRARRFPPAPELASRRRWRT